MVTVQDFLDFAPTFTESVYLIQVAEGTYANVSYGVNTVIFIV